MIIPKITSYFDISAGYEYLHYINSPQYVKTFGLVYSDIKSKVIHANEIRIWGAVDYIINNNWKVESGFDGVFFHRRNFFRSTIDPRLTLQFESFPHKVAVHFGRYVQYIHQLGFSETGMASDFWLVSGKRLEPQHSWGVSGNWNVYFPDANITIDLNTYWRRVTGQSEFNAQVLDILNSNYDPENYILTGRGYNLGSNITGILAIQDWNVTLSVGWGIAKRWYPGFKQILRARTDPGISLSSIVQWSPKRFPKWKFAANFRLNSGRPYTPATAMYIIAGNLITEYGLPNSVRLPLYHRLDISATFTLTECSKSRPGQSLNLSLINAYAHRNIEIQRDILDMNSFSIKSKSVSSLYRLVPSINYTLSF